MMDRMQYLKLIIQKQLTKISKNHEKKKPAGERSSAVKYGDVYGFDGGVETG